MTGSCLSYTSCDLYNTSMYSTICQRLQLYGESDPGYISEQPPSQNLAEAFEKNATDSLQCINKSFPFPQGKSSSSGWRVPVIQDKPRNASCWDRGHSEKRKVFSSKATGDQKECLWNSQGKWVSSNGAENRKTRTRPALLGSSQEEACPPEPCWSTPTS